MNKFSSLLTKKLVLRSTLPGRNSYGIVRIDLFAKHSKDQFRYPVLCR